MNGMPSLIHTDTESVPVAGHMKPVAQGGNTRRCLCMVRPPPANLVSSTSCLFAAELALLADKTAASGGRRSHLPYGAPLSGRQCPRRRDSSPSQLSHCRQLLVQSRTKWGEGQGGTLSSWTASIGEYSSELGWGRCPWHARWHSHRAVETQHSSAGDDSAEDRTELPTS